MSIEEFSLVGDERALLLQQSGITLVAPGLIGGGREVTTDAQTAGRDFTRDATEVDRALAEAGLEQRHTLVIEAPTPARTGSGRTAGAVAADQLALEVPLADGEAAFVLYTDEAGQASFHYRRASRAATAAGRALFAARQDEFLIPLRPGMNRAGGDGRALFGKIAAKVIRIVIVGLLPDQAGSAVVRRVQAWETKHRAHLGLHGGTADDLLDEQPKPCSLQQLRGRRSLLFIHGTTSSTAGAFGKLAGNRALLQALYRRYEGCVAGFNHHTMAVSVRQNVHDFHAALARLPGDYIFDIVCHSRGGLVARALAGLGNPVEGVRVHVGRIVFVATPNCGTDLAIPEKIPAFVERLTNYVNMLPDTAATISAGALLSVAGAIAEVGLPRLPGLADQAPGSELLSALARAPAGFGPHAAFQADYTAGGNLIDVIKDRVVDRIFGETRNDLVVPTRGVSERLEISPDRVVSFGGDDGVHHTNFFGHPKIAEIARFLAAQAQ